eukprot:SAG22_NODE_1916_length_3316_cov_6.514454_1_plen_131_part_10
MLLLKRAELVQRAALPAGGPPLYFDKRRTLRFVCAADVQVDQLQRAIEAATAVTPRHQQLTINGARYHPPEPVRPQPSHLPGRDTKSLAAVAAIRFSLKRSHARILDRPPWAVWMWSVRLCGLFVRTLNHL